MMQMQEKMLQHFQQVDMEYIEYWQELALLRERYTKADCPESVNTTESCSDISPLAVNLWM